MRYWILLFAILSLNVSANYHADDFQRQFTTHAHHKVKVALPYCSLDIATELVRLDDDDELLYGLAQHLWLLVAKKAQLVTIHDTLFANSSIPVSLTAIRAPPKILS